MVTRKGKQRKKVTKVVLAWKGKKFLNRAKEGGDNNISTFSKESKDFLSFYSPFLPPPRSVWGPRVVMSSIFHRIAEALDERLSKLQIVRRISIADHAASFANVGLPFFFCFPFSFNRLF